MKFLFSVIVAGLCFVSPSSAQVIKLGTVVPEGSPWHTALLEMGQKWKEASGGKVRLKIYAGGVIGDEQDMLRKINIRQLHAAALTSTTLMGVDKDIEVLTFPLLYRNNRELRRVMESLAPDFEKALEERGFKVLNWNLAGWARFFSTEPVLNPDDMRARKLFYWGSDSTYIEMLKQAGFHPNALAVTDLLPSLQTGLVDTFGAPPTAALSFQWFGLAKNMTDMRWQPLPSLTVMSLKQWEKIPAEFHAPLLEAARELSEGLWTETEELEQKAIDVMQEYGLKVHHPTPEELAQWETLIREKALPQFKGTRFSSEIYDRVTEILRELRAETP